MRISATAAMDSYFTKVRIAKTAQRVTDPKYGVGETAFSDGFPVLVTSQASIDAIRRRVSWQKRQH